MKPAKPTYEEISQALIMLIGYCMAERAKFEDRGLAQPYGALAVRLGVDPGYFAKPGEKKP